MGILKRVKMVASRLLIIILIPVLVIYIMAAIILYPVAWILTGLEFGSYDEKMGEPIKFIESILSAEE